MLGVVRAKLWMLLPRGAPAGISLGSFDMSWRYLHLSTRRRGRHIDFTGVSAEAGGVCTYCGFRVALNPRGRSETREQRGAAAAAQPAERTGEGGLCLLGAWSPRHVPLHS